MFVIEPIWDTEIMEKILNMLFSSYLEQRFKGRNVCIGDSSIQYRRNGECIRFLQEQTHRRMEYLQRTEGSCPESLTAPSGHVLKAISFYLEWKIVQLVLISKGKCTTNALLPYMLLCILITLGILYKKLLRLQLQVTIQHASDLSDRQ